MSPIKFFSIKKSPTEDLYWQQGTAEWVHIASADKYESEEYTKELIAAQPYMARFFKEAVIKEFYIVDVEFMDKIDEDKQEAYYETLEYIERNE